LKIYQIWQSTAVRHGGRGGPQRFRPNRRGARGWRLATAATVGYNLSSVMFVLIFQFEFDLLLLSMLKYW
jgi:hypothetical protein